MIYNKFHRLHLIIIIILLSNSHLISVYHKSESALVNFNSSFTNQTNSITTRVNQKEYNLTKRYQFDESLGAMNDIVIQDDLAFIAVRWGGLLIFNISNLKEPTLIGIYQEPVATISDTELTSGVFVRDDVVFIADGVNGLLILNISNPYSPFKIGQYKENSHWRDYFRVFVEDNYAFITARLYLVILNISDLTSPVKITEKENFGYNKNIEVKNKIVYLTSSSSVLIINASNPANLEELTVLDSTTAFTLQEDFLLTAAGKNNFITYNLSYSSFLTMIYNYTIPINGSVKYICSNAEFTYIASTDEIIVINISNISNPQIFTSISNLNWFYNTDDTISIKRKLTTKNELEVNDILFFIDYQWGLFIHNITKPTGKTLVAHYDCGKRAELVKVMGEYIYVASRVEWPYYPAELDIFTFNDDSLIRIGSYYTNDSLRDIIIIESFALLAASSGVEIIDISDPTNPSLVYKFPIGAYNMFYDQEFLYLCADINGLFIVNASDLTNLTLSSQIDDFYGYGYQAHDVYVYEKIAFVTDIQTFGGFGMINVSDPTNPTIISYIPLNDGIMGVQVEEDLVYLTAASSTLQIFDISNIYEPVKISDIYNEKWATGHFHIQNDIYYLAQWTNGSTLINIHDPSNPIEIISVKDSDTGLSRDLYFNNSLLFIADAWDGLEIWELSIKPINTTWKVVAILTSLTAGLIVAIITIVIIFKKKRRNLKLLWGFYRKIKLL